MVLKIGSYLPLGTIFRQNPVLVVQKKTTTKALIVNLGGGLSVEHSGLEPLTSTLPVLRSTR